jgi:hypothetical protein
VRRVTLSGWRLPEHLDAKLVVAYHDEPVVECPEEAARFVEGIMVAGTDGLINPGTLVMNGGRAGDWGPLRRVLVTWSTRRATP